MTDWQKKAAVLDERCKFLESEIDRLGMVIEELKKVIGSEQLIPNCFDLTEREAMIFCMLLAKDQATKSEIMTMYEIERSFDEVPEPKIVDVFVCKMRKKIKPYGIEINTIWGRGWSMSGPDKDKVKKLVMAEKGQTINPTNQGA